MEIDVKKEDLDDVKRALRILTENLAEITYENSEFHGTLNHTQRKDWRWLEKWLEL